MWNLFKWADPRTHDYRRRRWGHSITFITIAADRKSAHVAGWGHGVEKGDYILLANGGDTTRYRIKSVEYKRDPADMWFADIKVAPPPEVS